MQHRRGRFAKVEGLSDSDLGVVFSRTTGLGPLRYCDSEQVGQLDAQAARDSDERSERDVGSALLNSSVVRREHPDASSKHLLCFSVCPPQLLDAKAQRALRGIETGRHGRHLAAVDPQETAYYMTWFLCIRKRLERRGLRNGR